MVSRMSFELAERVSKVPQLFECGDKSTAILLRDAGYFDEPEALSVDEIEVALRREPKLTDLWLKRATDQRIAGGWGIDREDGAYRVQNYANGNCLLVRDRWRACAEFVVRYVAFVGEVLAQLE
jgi:hypothetical protein